MLPDRAYQHPGIWCRGILEGTFVAEVQQVFPKVHWAPGDLIKVCDMYNTRQPRVFSRIAVCIIIPPSVLPAMLP